MNMCHNAYRAPFMPRLFSAFLCYLLSASLSGAEPTTVQHAVDRGVSFLMRHRHDAGYWQESPRGNSYPIVMTSMAGLALMAAGNTPYEGPQAPALNQAIDILVNGQHQNGQFLIGGSTSGQPMFDQGFATLFLTQIAGMTGDADRERRIQAALQSAINFIVAAQSTTTGGWHYRPKSQYSEGAVTVSQLQALRAAHDAGIMVPKSVIDRAVTYLRHSMSEDGGICYSVRHRLQGSNPSLALSSAGLVCLYSAGAYDDPMNERLIGWLEPYVLGERREPMSKHYHTDYTRLYFNQGLFLHHERHYWESWYPEERTHLLQEQQADGGWPDNGAGRVFSTAVAIISLQLTERRLPILQP